MVVCSNDVTQAADVGMIQEGDDGCLASGSNLFGLIGAFFFGPGLMPVVGRATRNNLASDL
jgi:hypothetical protein